VGTAGERSPRVPAAPQPVAVPRVAVIGADLMLASRVTTALGAAGHEVEQSGSLPDRLDGVDLVIADLDSVEPEPLGSLEQPVLGFYRHTDTATKERADAAGLDLAVPRSRMVRELPELAARLLAD
jgi:nucleoside-diphosphate-sugar epimerase